MAATGTSGRPSSNSTADPPSSRGHPYPPDLACASSSRHPRARRSFHAQSILVSVLGTALKSPAGCSVTLPFAGLNSESLRRPKTSEARCISTGSWQDRRARCLPPREFSCCQETPSSANQCSPSATTGCLGSWSPSWCGVTEVIHRFYRRTRHRPNATVPVRTGIQLVPMLEPGPRATTLAADKAPPKQQAFASRPPALW